MTNNAVIDDDDKGERVSREELLRRAQAAQAANPSPVAKLIDDLIIIEREAFEDYLYNHYITRETDVRAQWPNVEYKPMMKREQYFKREPNGEYLLAGLDPAWWGWRAAKGLL